MLIKPYAWSDVKPGAKTRGTHKPSIQIFAMTEDHKTVYIRIPAPSIYLLHLAPDKIPQRPTVIRYLASRFNPILIEDSVNNPAVLALIFAEPTEFEQDVLDLVDEPIFFRDDYVEWLLSHRRIEPYNWIELVDPEPLPRAWRRQATLDSSHGSTLASASYTDCDYEFISDFRNLKRVPPPKPDSLVDDAGIIYWDIEAQSSTGNFTEAKTPGDFVTSISVLTSISGQLRGYVFISIGPVLQDRLKQYTVPFEVIECADEADLFDKYYKFLASLKPGIKIGYNDSFYDTPYLIDRDHLLKIKVPNMSHIRTYPARVMPISYPSPLPGTTLDRAKEYYLPDSENLDMVLYFRRYLPGLNNYKLETVSRYILGEGKTGLPYDEMFRIVRERDPEGILELIDYSFIDSVLLGQLEGEAGVLKSLNNLANDTGVLRQDLLRLSDDKLIESIFCRLDFGYLFDQISFESTAHLRPLKEGIYQGLLSMDYKNLILEAFNQAFVQTDNKWIGILGLVSIGLPTPILNRMLYCSFTPIIVRTLFLGLLNEIGVGIAGVDNARIFYLRSNSPSSPFLILKDEYEYVFVTGMNVSVRFPEKGGKPARYGKCNICRPEFPYMEQIFEEYVTDLREGEDPRGRIITDISKETVDKFVIVGKIKPLEDFKTATSWSARLAKEAQRRGLTVTSWMTVPYIRVYQDPGLAKKRLQRQRKETVRFYPENSAPYLLIEPEDIIDSGPMDTSYYISKTNDMLALMDRLPLYT